MNNNCTHFDVILQIRGQWPKDQPLKFTAFCSTVSTLFKSVNGH